jgi:pimeloyl-ACP methyl ester carboxylesterase
MEWGFFPCLAELLSERGFTVLRFNFTGSGMRPGDERVTDLEAFASAKFTRDLDELLQLMEQLGRSFATEVVDPERIALFGHSRGGGTALLAAAAEGWIRRVRALVTWAAVNTFDRVQAEDKTLWNQQGWLPVVNARTGQELRLDRSVLSDLETHRAELDLVSASARRRAPWLVIHGERDESVPIEEAHRLVERAASPHRLLVVPDADHTFGARHPFDGPTPQLIAAINATQAWFRQYLG